jgi:hypothetical protein
MWVVRGIVDEIDVMVLELSGFFVSLYLGWQILEEEG